MDAVWQTVSECFDAFYRKLSPNHSNQWVVGFSGGCDSTALLYALQKWIQLSGYDIQLSAIHINHQLHEQSSALQTHCQDYCNQLGIPITVKRVSVEPSRKGMESQARHARFSAFSKHLPEAGLIFLSHHQQDQAETFLLNALRGSDINALGGMNPLARFEHFWIARPWLEMSKDTINALADQAELNWVEDPTNLNLNITRNFIRHEIISRLNNRIPSTISMLARSALRCAEVNETQVEFVTDWLQSNCKAKNRLPLMDWRALPKSVQVTVLKQWMSGNTPANAQFQQILRDARGQVTKGEYVWKHEHKAWTCFLWRDYLFLYDQKTLASIDFGYEQANESWAVKPAQPLSQKIHFQGKYRTIKSICKEQRILPWWRKHIKLLYKDGDVVMVGNLCGVKDSMPSPAFKGPESLCL